MSWDRPSPLQDGAKTSDAIRIAAEAPARADSSAFQKPVAAHVSLTVRVIGLAAPGSWGLLTAAMWWAWRVTAMYARGEVGGAASQNTALAWGLFADLVMVHLCFILARVVAVSTTAECDLRHRYVTIVKRSLFVLFFLSTMLRILDVVQSAMVQRPPDAEFWLGVMRDPDLLVSGPVFGALAISTAATAIGRYAVGCDLEITQSLAEFWDHRKAITLTAIGLAVTLLLSLAMMTGKPYGGRGRLVEIGAPAALLQAIDRKNALTRAQTEK